MAPLVHVEDCLKIGTEMIIGPMMKQDRLQAFDNGLHECYKVGRRGMTCALHDIVMIAIPLQMIGVVEHSTSDREKVKYLSRVWFKATFRSSFNSGNVGFRSQSATNSVPSMFRNRS